VTIDVNKPDTKENIDQIRWYLLHGVNVYFDSDGDWMAYIPAKCNALDERGECDIYAKRPKVCREYTQDECDKYDEKASEEIIFREEKEFLKYIEDNR